MQEFPIAEDNADYSGISIFTSSLNDFFVRVYSLCFGYYRKFLLHITGTWVLVHCID